MIGILILNWNTKEETLNLLSDLSKQDYTGDKTILVIDNGSNDSAELGCIVEQFPYIKTIQNTDNIGVSKGFNQGIRALEDLGCEVFILLNSDARMHDTEFLRKYINRYTGLAKPVLLSPLILYEHDNSVWYANGYFNPIFGGPVHSMVRDERKSFNLFSFVKDVFGALRHSTVKGVPFERTEFSKKLGLQPAGDFITGCCMIFDSKFIENVGYYDEAFFAYYEDLDICFRAKLKGYELLVDYDLVLDHKRSASVSDGASPRMLSRFQVYLWSKNSVIFARKHLSGTRMVKFILSRILIQPFWFLKSKSKLWFFVDFYKGMLVGVTGKPFL